MSSRSYQHLDNHDSVELMSLQGSSTFEQEVENAFNTGYIEADSSPMLQMPNDCDHDKISVKSKHESQAVSNSFFRRLKTYREKHLSGWRGGIASNATMAAAVLFINLVFLLWGTTKFAVKDGLAIVYSGSCETVEATSVVAHLFINIMSTLLLGASNYAMQVASSPSRADVDRAHQRRKELDIGVLSLRNFRWVSKARVLAYVLLLLSSIPLHFIYNSVLSQSLSYVASPVILIVTPEYVTGSATGDIPASLVNTTSGTLTTIAQIVAAEANSRELKQIGVRACNNSMALPQQNKYESYIFVQTSDKLVNSTLVNIAYGYSGYSIDDLYLGNGSYADWHYDLSDCWAASARGANCQLIFNSRLMIGVILANIIKCVVMLLMVVSLTKPSLVTLGDGIASFLEADDTTTIGLRSIEKRYFRERWLFQDTAVYHRVQKRWRSSASTMKWALSITICVLFVFTAAGLLAWGLANLHMNWDSIPDGPVKSAPYFSLGFGQPSGYTAVQASGKIISLPPDSNPFSMILLANTPQLVLSIGYLILNNLITGMFGAWEWSQLSQKRTKLRTTTPQGQQKSTYRLQLPYKYSLSLMIIMIMLHYFVSTSLFIVNIAEYDWSSNGTLYDNSEYDYEDMGNAAVVDPSGWVLNYSPIAIICTLAASLLLIAFPIALGYRKLNPGIPAVGSSSALISAACHPPQEEENAGLLPVQWGLLEGSVDTQIRLGHCTISSGEVSLPDEGQIYSLVRVVI